MPSVTARELVAFLKARSFEEERQSGSHITMVDSRGISVTVPMHSGADLGRGLAI